MRRTARALLLPACGRCRFQRRGACIPRANRQKKVLGIETILYVELNCFALAILLLIYLNLRRYINKYLLDQNIFLIIVYVNALVLVLDTFMWLLDSVEGTAARVVYSAITTGYYLLNPLFCALWYLYMEYYIKGSRTRLKKRAVIAMIPVVILGVVSILSNFNGMAFRIDENNIYHRGPYFAAQGVICLLYPVYTAIFTIANRKKLQRKDFATLLFFPVPPFIGTVIQMFFYGVSLIWTCTTISSLLIFIKYQNSQLNTDYLTGLYNRRQLDNYLHTKAQNANGKLLAGLMIDLNFFKAINDTYGHHAGDEALTYVADILKETFRMSDFIARYGGDEFIVIMEINNRQDLERALARLHENVGKFNAKKLAPYAISLSIGCDICPDACPDTARFIKRIDALMYEDKNKQHDEDDGIPKF